MLGKRTRPLRVQWKASPSRGWGEMTFGNCGKSISRTCFCRNCATRLPPPFRLALSRMALLEVPLPSRRGARQPASEAHSQDATGRWLGLGLVQRFGNRRSPLTGLSVQREFLTRPERLPDTQAREAHGAAAAFFQECFEKDREQELRLPIGVELLACLHHANAAGDKPRRRWAVAQLGRRLINRAEFASARELVGPLLTEDRHPDLLQVAARVALETGDWKAARTLTEEEQQARQAIGDRANERA